MQAIDFMADNFKERAIVFVDGNNLHRGLRKCYGIDRLELEIYILNHRRRRKPMFIWQPIWLIYAIEMNLTLLTLYREMLI
jgi:hypothetical protein